MSQGLPTHLRKQEISPYAVVACERLIYTSFKHDRSAAQSFCFFERAARGYGKGDAVRVN